MREYWRMSDRSLHSISSTSFNSMNPLLILRPFSPEKKIKVKTCLRCRACELDDDARAPRASRCCAQRRARAGCRGQERQTQPGRPSTVAGAHTPCRECWCSSLRGAVMSGVEEADDREREREFRLLNGLRLGPLLYQSRGSRLGSLC